MPIRTNKKFHCCKRCAEMYESKTKRAGICPKCSKSKGTGEMIQSFIKSQKEANKTND